MSFSSFWRLPAPWDETKLRAAILEAATLFPGAKVEVKSGSFGGKPSLSVYIQWPQELVKRYCSLPELEREAGPGEISIYFDEDTYDVVDGFSISTLSVKTDKKRNVAVLGLAVQSELLVGSGYQGALACVGKKGLYGSLRNGEIYRTINDRDPLPPVNLRALSFRGDEAVVVGDEGTVLRRVRDQKHAFHWQSLPPPCKDALNRVAFDQSGRICVGGRDISFRLEENGSWTSAPAAAAGHDPASVSAELGRRCTAFCYGHDGSLWMGTVDGQLFRSQGALKPIEIGKVGRIESLVALGDSVIAAVSAVTNEPSKKPAPGLVFIHPAACVRIDVNSNRSWTRATWGATCMLATEIAKRCGGAGES
jgi:hypothetical protein